MSSPSFAIREGRHEMRLNMGARLPDLNIEVVIAIKDQPWES
jgi:hypothetical protein